MADPLDLQEDTAFSAVLRFLGRPGFAVRNVLKGNLGGAVRQAADFVLDPWDAFLPGDLIPEISQKQDYVETSDLVGGMEPGWAKFGVDLAGGILTDPLTYTGLGLVKNVALAPAKAATMLAKGVAPKIPGGVAALEGIATGVKNAGIRGRELIGAERISPSAAKIIHEAESLEAASGAVQKKSLEGALKLLSDPADQAIATKVMQNIVDERAAGGIARPLIDDGVTTAAYPATGAVRSMTGAGGMDAADVLAANAAIPDVVEVSRDPLSKMLGGVDVTQPRRSSAMVAPVTDTVNMQSGGLIPGMSKVGAADLPQAAARFTKITDQKQVIRDRLLELGVTGTQFDRVAQALDSYVDISAGSFRELTEKGTFQKPIGEDLKLWSPMYAPRQYLNADDEMLALAKQGGRKGTASSAKARTIGHEGQQLADALNADPALMLDEAFVPVTLARAGQQGQMLKRAAIARGVVDDFAKSADAKMSKAATDVENWTGMHSKADQYKAAGLTQAEQLAYEAKGSSLFGSGGGSTPLAKAMPAALEELGKVDVETANALTRAFYGLEPRGAFMESLAKLNSVFKPYATAGAFIPRISFNVRNLVQGGGFQVLMNPSARQVWPEYAKSVAPTFMRSIDDGIERLTGARIGDDDFKSVKAALEQSGGRVDDALAAIPDRVQRSALQHGVITDGFSSAELLADQLARTGWSKKWRDMRDWPAEITQGIEKRMRFGTFKALVAKGVPDAEAAQIVEDTFFKYRPNSELNRAARDVIPFFQFTAKATPQVLRSLVNAKGFAHPGTYMRAGAQQLYGQGSDALLPPQLQGSPVVPIGDDESGNPQYLTSTGLPFEVLDMIPNLSDSPSTAFKQIRQNIVGSMNPTIKSAASATFGVDTFFGSNYGSWDRAPYLAQAAGAGDRSEAARIYNIVAGTGLIQPISSPVQYLSGMLDPRKSTAEAIGTAITGARVSSVDEDRALQQLVEEKLKSDPSIQRYEALFAYSPDPEQQALLDELKRVKAQIRAKKQAEPVAP